MTYNAGRDGRINEFMDKYQIQQRAKKHGFNVLDSYVIPITIDQRYGEEELDYLANIIKQ